METVRVRFAPSPTGQFHVGSARTALYNWLFAKRMKGTFILRIEDTDRARSTDEMTQAILKDMEWLGLNWDEGPYFQSQRSEIYEQNARKLLESGWAYRCFCTKEELDARKQEQMKKGGDWRYDKTCRNGKEQSGRPCCIRFKVPENEKVSFSDIIYGDIEVGTSEIEDFVILRSDGSPTYQFTVASDDIEMNISHIIRGNDHISNTPKQLLIYRALGKEPPRFAHLPLILGRDKSKLSKRHGATSTGEFRNEGILSEALVNYLALLGWSPGDDREFLRREELTELFSLERVNASSAVFDIEKLTWLNGQYIIAGTAEDLFDEVKEGLIANGLWRVSFDSSEKQWLTARIEMMRTRARTTVELAESLRPYLSDDIEYDEKDVRKRLKDEDTADIIANLSDTLAGLDDFTEKSLEEAVRCLAEKLGVGAGKLIHPLRVGLTGKMAGPGAFILVEMIGREKTVERLGKLVRYLGQKVKD